MLKVISAVNGALVWAIQITGSLIPVKEEVSPIRQIVDGLKAGGL